MLNTYQVTHQITEALPESTWSEICRRLRTEPAMLSVCQHPGVLDSLLSYSDISELSSWIINKNIPLKEMITHRYHLVEAEAAFNQFSAGGTGKVIFEW